MEEARVAECIAWLKANEHSAIAGAIEWNIAQGNWHIVRQYCDRAEEYRRWKEVERYTPTFCFGCRRPRDPQRDTLWGLYAERPAGAPLMWLCKRCRRTRARSWKWRMGASLFLTLREFRDAVRERYPEAEVVTYRPTATGIERRVFSISDDE